MSKSHLSEFLGVVPLHLSLSILKGGLLCLEIEFFRLDISLNLPDFLLPLEESGLHASLSLILKLLDAGLQVVDVSNVLVAFGLGDQDLFGEVDLDSVFG